VKWSTEIIFVRRSAAKPPTTCGATQRMSMKHGEEKMSVISCSSREGKVLSSAAVLRRNRGEIAAQILALRPQFIACDRNVWPRYWSSVNSLISAVAADWHELMIPWRIMWPSIARYGEQLDPRCSTQTYYRPSQCTPYPVSYYSFPIPLRVGDWVGLSTHHPDQPALNLLRARTLVTWSFVNRQRGVVRASLDGVQLICCKLRWRVNSSTPHRHVQSSDSFWRWPRQVWRCGRRSIIPVMGN